ncbi:hypothetical protein BC835DRAFT_1394810 [Cytidiella melzeri]|nr:hypothetical protein BC835DRAFT_1394810 [Cytidiella melzeri]
MHTILCCRVILHLRIAAALPDPDNATTMSSSRPIRFAQLPRRHAFMSTEGSESLEMESTMRGTFGAEIQPSGGRSRGDGNGEGSSVVAAVVL